MRKITKLFVTLMLLCVAGVVNAATEYEVDQKFTSVAALEGQLVAIVNESDGKAIYNKDAQNMAYDVYSTAITGTAYLWKFHSLAGETDPEVQSCYAIEAVKADGSSIGLWGNPAIFINSGAEGGFDGCFILGQKDQYGTDVKYGGVWEVEYTENGFTFKNKARGGYFAGVNPAPTGIDPIYWTICTLKEKASTDPLAEQKNALEAAIAKGKMYNALAYTDATFATLTAKISDGETALAASEATAESLTGATTDINNAIAALAFKDGFSSLKDVAFGSWSGWGVDAEMTQPGTPAWTLFEATGQPYGDPSVNAYADLSAFDKLYIVAVSGTPRILLNRDADGGQWSETESESHLIDNTKGGWSAKYFAQNENVYTVDLKQLVADKGFAHLTSIKGANQGNVTITGLYLYKEFKPAYGTIWENGETTPDGDYSLISLNKAYFNDFAKVADTLKIDFEVVAASRVAAPARNIKKGEISLWAGTDEVFTLSNIMADVDNINIALTEDMIAKLAAADAVTLKFKNMTVSKVVLAEKVVPPFQPTDVTEKVNQNGWQSEVGNVGNYTKDVAQKEQYLENTTTNGQILYQTVEGLENGTYTVELYANASYTPGRKFASTALNGDLGRVVIYAGDVEKTIPVIHQVAVAENNIVKLENVVVSDGTLKMGMRKDIEGSNWHTIQIKSLVHASLEANADEAAQNEYWKGIATTILGTEAYANIAGSEKAAMVAAETKAAVQAAIAPFYSAKEAYDALVDIINKGKSVEMDMSEAETLLNSATTTADQAAAKAAELVHPVNLAYNTSKATEGADMTFVIVNPSFENGTTGWTYETSNDHGAKEVSNGTYAMTNADGNYLFNIWSSGNQISQMIEDLPNGTYKLKAVAATDGGHQIQLNANDKSYKIDAIDKGTGVEGEVEFKVLDNKATIGAEGVDKYWYKVDNFRLTYVKGFDLDALVQAYNDALADAQTVEGKMNKDVKAALEAAIAAQVDKTDPDNLAAVTAALTAATAAAKASVNAYKKAAGALNSMKTLTENTNFYTAEAFENYYTKWAVAYEADTLKTNEANALQDPFIITSWRSDNTVDDLLMSVWDENPMNFDSYHVNTWSDEGVKDGTGFIVPFIEYWTGDANSLAAKTLTATVNVEKDGIYDVQAWVRVRVKNGGSSVADGITMTVNDGDAVDVCAGTPVDNSQFFLDNFTARGIVENNTLTLKFIVADANNISWLAFRDVKYTFNEEATTGISSVETVKTLNGNIYNLNGQKVEKAQKGLYIMNGKKVYVK